MLLLLSEIFVCSSLVVAAAATTAAPELVVVAAAAAVAIAVTLLLLLAAVAASLVRLTGILCALCPSDEGAETLAELELEVTGGNLTDDGSSGGALPIAGADGLAELLGVLAAAAL